MSLSPARPLKVGVIGLGVGEQHVLSYQAIPGVTVQAVSDIDPDHLAAVAARRGVPEQHTDWRRITDHPEIEAVSICSYDDGHAEQAIRAFNNGKHVFVEKPVALAPRESEAIVRAMEDAGKLISSNLILRESPRFKEVRRMVQAGELGDVFYLEGDYVHQILWKLTEGWRGRMDFYCTTYGGGIHLIDLMRWILGHEVKEVSAMGTDLPTRGSQYRFPDTITALLRFDNDVLAKNLTTFAPQRTKFHALSVYGSRGTFINDMPDAKLFFGDGAADEMPMTVPYPAVEKGDLLPDFIEAIRTDTVPNVNAQDVFRVMDVCYGVWRSLCDKHTVDVAYVL